MSDLDVGDPRKIFELDWEAAFDKLEVGEVSDLTLDQERAALVMVAFAMEVANESRALIKWAKCMHTLKLASCVRETVVGEKAKTFVDTRSMPDYRFDFAAWQGWVVDLWCGAILGLGLLIPGDELAALAAVSGLSLALFSSTARPSSCLQAMGRHGYILINVDQTSPSDPRTFIKELDLVMNGDEWDQAGAIMDLAVALVHELSHTCNTPGDAGSCSAADILETGYQYALASRYPLVGMWSRCFRSDNYGRMFLLEPSPSCLVRVNPSMFGSDQTFSVGKVRCV